MNKGFSLMEVLLVLALLMAGIGIGLPAYNGIAVKKEEERFFELLRNDIYFAQSTAYNSENQVSVLFKPEFSRYDVGENILKPFFSRQIPKSVTVGLTSNLESISYWKQGAVLASGTIHFNTSTGKKTIVVHLGKGRVVFSE